MVRAVVDVCARTLAERFIVTSDLHCSTRTQHNRRLASGEVGGAYYGLKHPMKPHRMRMTNEMIIEYGLDEHLDVFVSHSEF